MAASMSRAYIQFSLSRQFLVDTIWKDQSINYVLQTVCLSHVQCYHATSILLKKRKAKNESNVKLAWKKQFLKESTILFEGPTKQSLPTIEVWNNITVQEIADCVKKDATDILNFLFIKYRNINFKKDTVLPTTVAVEVVKACGGKTKFITKQNTKKEIIHEDIVRRPPPDKSQLVPRHPVVTIMGHVDHGKTTLLDALRCTSVVKSEFGGITQHIGAFNVTLQSGKRVTFLDTPGHAAFTSMRYRGAYVTDIVVLVVAADDGVKEQTLQSIEMAKAANVPIIVAINKIDKPNANIEQTQGELAKNGVIVEELGGEVQCIKISALKGINLDQLTESIVLQAEIMNLQGDPVGLVEGVIIECTNDTHRGKLVTALIQRGTLKKGRFLVSGLAWAKVRAIFDDSGGPVLEAKPSEAVQIIGWKMLPNVGDEILEVESDKVLQSVLKFREQERNHALAMEHKIMADKKEEEHSKKYKHSLKIRQIFGRDREVMKQLHQKEIEEMQEKKKMEREDDVPTLNVILKADVAGSIEAILDIFETYTFDKICRLNVIHYGIGLITDKDLQLAETFNAIIYGFNVNAMKQTEEEAKKTGIPIRFYNVVYKLLDNIKEEIHARLPKVDVEQVLGEAEVLQNFEIKEGNKKVHVAGCRCIKGMLLKSAMYNIVRGNESIYKGKLASMKRLKDEVSSVAVNLECGLKFEDKTILFQPGDTIICFKLQTQPQTIDWNFGF